MKKPIKGEELFDLPSQDKTLSVEELIERNEDYYRDNILEAGRKYGGALVTDKEIAKALMRMVNRYARTHQDERGNPVYPDCLRPPELPAVEYIPVQAAFKVQVPGGRELIARKWYFFKRARRYAIGGIPSKQ